MEMPYLTRAKRKEPLPALFSFVAVKKSHSDLGLLASHFFEKTSALLRAGKHLISGRYVPATGTKEGGPPSNYKKNTEALGFPARLFLKRGVKCTKM